MAKLGGEKFTWVIEDFFSLQSKCLSETYEIGGCKCWLSAGVNANYPDFLSVDLCVSYGSSLLNERRRYVKYRLAILHQLWEDLCIFEEGLHMFDSSSLDSGFASTFFISKHHDTDGGFLVDEVKIVAEVNVFEVIDISDIPEEFKKTTRPPIKTEENDGDVSSVFLKEASTIKESNDVNGFQVFTSQVESVRHIFEKHPDITVGFHAKNQHLRNSCMLSLLSIIETLCQSLQELSNEDLVEADIALTHLKDSGFKVDWLEKKLDKVKGKKEKELSALAILQESEINLLKLKKRLAELDALIEKQKEELSATRTSLSFEDVV